MHAPGGHLLAVGTLSLSLGCAGSTAGIGGPSGDGGSDGTDGMPPPPALVTCTPDAGPSGPVGVDPAVTQQVSGTNGVFTSTCDSRGNLVGYKCETQQRCGPPPNPPCTVYETGAVVSETIDCSGHCQNGACDGRCPAMGQAVTYLSVSPSGDAVLRNDADGRQYACMFLLDEPGGNYDCQRAPTTGLMATVGNVTYSGATSYGANEYCVGPDFANLGITIPGVSTQDGYSCVYACGIAP